MSDKLPKGLFKRGGTYAVRYTVPMRQRATVGRKEIVRTLGTSDLSEALLQRERVLEGIRASLAEVPCKRSQTTVLNVEPATTIKETSERWLRESDGISSASAQRYRAILRTFEQFSENCDVRLLDRQLALQFMAMLQDQISARTGKTLSQKSLKAYQICLSSYWRVLDHWGLVDPNMRNPFSSLLRRVPGKKVLEDPRKKALRPVTREEAEKLLCHINDAKKLQYRFEMHVVVKILWVSACRLDEISNIKLDQIDDNGSIIVLKILNAKTAAGNRDIYLVGRQERDLVRSAIELAKTQRPLSRENNGMLFPRLRRGGYDRKASHYLAKAFGRARSTVPRDPQESQTWDMHSFRRMGVSALVNAGIERGARNLVVGHSNADDLGLSVYARHGKLDDIRLKTFQAHYDEIGGGLKTPLRKYGGEKRGPEKVFLDTSISPSNG